MCQPGVGIALVYRWHRRQRADRPWRRLRSCSPDSGDLPAIRRSAKGNAIRHYVRAVHVCEGLPSAGFSRRRPIPLVIKASCQVLRFIMEVRERAQCENVDQLRRCGSLNLRRSSWLLFPRRLRPTASLFRPRQSAGPRSMKPHSSCWHGMPRRYSLGSEAVRHENPGRVVPIG